MKKKSLITLCCILICIISSVSYCYAYTIKVGSSSNGKYQENGNCFLEDRNSATIFANYFMQNITKKFDGTGEIPATEKFQYANDAAWKNDMVAGIGGYTNIDDVDFMIFVGHGLAKGVTYKPLDGSSFVRSTNALHYYTNNGGNFAQSSLGGETFSGSNLNTIEASKWARNGTSTKWVALFTCNFLNPVDPYAKKEKIMNGLHILMGFSTKMYINSLQGRNFGIALRDGAGIIDAYFNSCSYQTGKIEGGVTAVVYYASQSRNDTIYDFSSKPALNDSSQYRQITKSYKSK